LTAFPKPATLTFIQFGFVSSYCLLFSYLASRYPRLKTAIPALKHGIRPPTRDVIRTTLPMAFFQIGGHLLSSSATQKIPVSLVHTIKGLSPLFTVFAYRALFNIRYPVATYVSLIPLTIGVMLACSASFKGNLVGILYALLAAIIFVTQNIWSKRLFNEAAKAEAEGEYTRSKKLDKLNLLCYSSGLAFLLTAPIWLWSEGFGLISDLLADGTLELSDKAKIDHGRLTLEFLFNGTFHFGQNIIAFVLLSITSPVTYSVASLIKRVFVVVVAIIWFRNPTTRVQAVGILLTFLGLYLYDRTGHGGKADKKARLAGIKEESGLPLTEGANWGAGGSARSRSSSHSVNGSGRSAGWGYGVPSMMSTGNINGGVNGKGRQRGSSNAGTGSGLRAEVNGWLPPGTRMEDTWTQGDVVLSPSAA
jgi:solute carrier family 35 protein E1